MKTRSVYVVWNRLSAENNRETAYIHTFSKVKFVFVYVFEIYAPYARVCAGGNKALYFLPDFLIMLRVGVYIFFDCNRYKFYFTLVL